MRIRAKLTLQFTVIVTLILIIFSVSIYYLSANYRKKEFYYRLRIKSVNTAKLLSREVTEVNQSILKAIDKNSVNLPEEKIAVYDINNKLIYSSDENRNQQADEKLLNCVRRDKEVHYREDGREVIGLLFEGQPKLL